MNVKKVLFYTNTPRYFRTTLIGHLFEICQVWPAVLLSEKLDGQTENILKDTNFFPKLEKIILLSQFSGESSMGVFAKNKYLCVKAKEMVEKEKPDIVISASDMHSMFEMYLMRFAKQKSAMTVCLQPAVDADDKITTKWVDFTNVTRLPDALPLWLRIFLIICRKYLGHFLYYWILPLSVGQKPFVGKSSYILMRGNSGMRDGDYQIVFSKREIDIYIKAGVNSEKLKILSHPLLHRTAREFFKKAYFNKAKTNGKNKKTVLLLLPTAPISLRKKDWYIIPAKECLKVWLEIIILVKTMLPKWEVLIKPHPAINNFAVIKKEVEKISGLTIIDPKEPVDEYLEMADTIIGLPRSASTVLFTASLQCPGKPIASLDFHQEVLGDFYKNFEGIEYIDSKENFISFLKKISVMVIENRTTYGKLDDYGTIDLLKELANEHDEKSDS